MFPKIVCLFALIGLAAGQAQVRHLQLNGAHLIDTGNDNYAISSPLLTQMGWRTVSINGQQATIYGQNCQPISRSIQSLSNSESAPIKSARQQILAVDSAGATPMGAPGTVVSYGSSRYSLMGNSVSINNGHNLQMSSFQSNGLSVSKYGPDSFSASKPNFPNNMARIFIDHDTVTYIYHDGTVQMKPLNCLDANEQQSVQQLRLEVNQAEQHFQANMRQFQQNMQNMAQNMQHMGQNMHQGMQNMAHNMNMNAQNMNQQLQHQMLNMQQNLGNWSPFNQPQQQMSNGYGMNQQQFARPMSPFSNAFSGVFNQNPISQQFGAFGPQQLGGGAGWPFGASNNQFMQGFQGF